MPDLLLSQEHCVEFSISKRLSNERGDITIVHSLRGIWNRAELLRPVQAQVLFLSLGGVPRSIRSKECEQLLGRGRSRYGVVNDDIRSSYFFAI
jgi:hypothetical protein